jgi:hypothetical protein
MKKLIYAFNIILILSLVIVAPAFAQGSTTSQAPGSWVSSINIQNIGTGSADVYLAFYDSTGSQILNFHVTPVIPAGGSRSLYVPNDVTPLASGQYSVISSSDQPLEVVANASSTTPSQASAYNGFLPNQTGQTVYFPGLYKNYYGFWSELVLQNVDATSASITIEFYNQATGAKVAGADITATIPANATRVFALQDFSLVPSGNTNGIMSAKITSDKNLAALANNWTSAAHGELSNYNGFVSGSTTVVYASGLYKNYYGFVSALTVQNIGTSSGDIRITYSNGTIENKTLLANQAFQYYQPDNASLPSGNTDGVFSAKIESLSGQPIVALVNLEHKVNGLLASYNGLIGATTKVGCPVVMKAFYGWFSAETVQNVGTSATDITITYASGQTKTFTNVPANGTRNIVENTTSGSVLPDVSSVSALIESSGQPIVAVVQENSNDRYAVTPGDYLTAYSCTPH